LDTPPRGSYIDWSYTYIVNHAPKLGELPRPHRTEEDFRPLNPHQVKHHNAYSLFGIFLTIAVDCDEYHRRMDQAEYTFSLIDADIQAGGYSWAAFKAQQAAEFAMKALLRSLGIASFGHNLVKFFQELKGLCEPSDGNRLGYCSSLLDGLYSSSRYPDAYTEGFPAQHITESMARECKSCSKAIIDWVKGCSKC
jgi:HEPN domain-containing protein